MIKQETIDEIKRVVPCTNYLDKSKGHNMYCCPWCGSGKGANNHYTGALEYYPEDNHVHCHACNEGGDNIALVQKVFNLDGSDGFTEALKVLAAEGGITLEDAPESPQNALRSPGTAEPAQTPTEAEKTPPRANYKEYIEKCHAAVSQTDYFHGRELTDETIEKWHLGWDAERQMILIPYPYTHYGYWIRRNLAENKDDRQIRKPKRDEAGPEPIFNKNALYSGEPTFVVEGQIDAISIEQVGGSAVALGNAGKDRLLAQIDKQAPAAPLILFLDADDTGRPNQRDLAQALDERDIPYLIADFNFDKYDGEGLKDANDLLMSDSFVFTLDVEGLIARASDPAELENDPTGINSFLTEIYSERYKATPTGIEEVDELLDGGLIPQTLITLSAEPGAGKTAMMTMIFESMAKSGHPGLVFNLEMSREQLLARSISRRILINSRGSYKLTALDVLRGFSHTETTKEKVKEAVDQYRKECGDRLRYNPGNCDTDLDKILSYISKQADAALAAGEPAPNIAVDYLQLLTSSKREDGVEIIKRAVAGLKMYAVKYSAIVFIISAQSRRVNESSTPTMTAGRDSSSIEYSADLLLQLIREDPEDHPDKVTLYVNKSRFTKITREGEGYTFNFHGGQSYFTAWETGEFPTDKKTLPRV